MGTSKLATALPSFLSLPSFSGCLDTPSGETPLLRYPLRLGPARRLRLRAPMPTRVAPGLSGAVRNVLGGPCACPCIQVDGVRVVAGRPEEVHVA